jgi:AcrR family transcriptional regulator
MLQAALLTLMQSRAFDEIAVQDITETATVNRATFYDHYTDKYDLLKATIAGGFHQLLAERNVRYDGACPAAALAIIQATCDFLVQGHADGRCDRHSAFAPLVDDAIVSAIRRMLLAGMTGAAGALPQATRATAMHNQMRATAASAAIYSAVKEWFQAPGHPPAEEIAPLILQMVLPLLTVDKNKAADSRQGS